MYSVEEQEILSVRPGITDLSSLTFSDLQSHVGSENPDEAFSSIRITTKKQITTEVRPRTYDINGFHNSHKDGTSCCCQTA